MPDMPLSEIQDVLACELFSGPESLRDVQIRFGCASDLMSDVLAFSRAGAVLLTGLVTAQTIYTADIAEIGAVVIVRGKRPAGEVITLARARKIPLLATPYSMYEACGKLYEKGLVSTMDRISASPMPGP
jgi:predicted transcriptional regulator